MWKVTHHEKSCSAFEKNYGAADTKALSTTAIFRLLLYDSVCECLCKHFFCVLQKGRARGRFIYSARAQQRARWLTFSHQINARARPPAFFPPISPRLHESERASEVSACVHRPVCRQGKSHFGTLHPPANFFYASFPSHIIKEFSLFTRAAQVLSQKITSLCTRRRDTERK